MERRFVVDRDFFPRLDVAQRDEENVIVQNFHEGVRLAGMIYVMGAVAAATAVKAPAIIDSADAKLPACCPTISFSIRNFLARVLRDFVSAFEGRD